MKNQKGITLIALVITIIVMLILAGVSISLLLDDDGVITKAKEAATEMSLAELKEKLELMTLDLKIDNQIGNYTVQNSKNEFFERAEEEFGEENCKINGNEVEIKTASGKFYVTINNNLEITVFDAEKKKENAEDVSEIFKRMLTGDAGAEQELKEKNINDWLEFYVGSDYYIYAYDINALYNRRNGEYILKEDKPEVYAFVEDLTMGKNTLEKYLIGMSTEKFLNEQDTIKNTIKTETAGKVEIGKLELYHDDYRPNGFMEVKSLTVTNGGRVTTYGPAAAALPASGIGILIEGNAQKITKIFIDYSD